MRRPLASLLVFATAVATLVAFPASRGAAAGSFTFFGSGWGNGLGLSQWGAYGLAEKGWSAERILTHFFSDTKVAQDDSPPRYLRIGLVQGLSKVRLEAEAGPVDLYLGTKTGDPIATVPRGETWTVRAAGSDYRILDADGRRIATGGGPNTNLLAVYERNGARVHIPEAGYTYAHGRIEFNLYDCGSGCVERLINVIAPQPYLYGIAEVPSSWPKVALRVQAIAARSYAFAEAAARSTGWNDCNCDLVDTSLDQVYTGWDKENGTDGDRWVAAVDATDGLVVRYKGETIPAYYSSSSGGFTEDNENVWGGTPLPYLRGVCDPGDYVSANPNRVWQRTYTAQEVTDRLRLGIGTVTGFSVTERGVSGRIVELTVKGEGGSETLSGFEVIRDFKWPLDLPDDRVWINNNRQITGKIRAKYDAILCAPGLATSKQLAVAGGLRQLFEHGAIYYERGVGAHELHGDVLSFYRAQGGPAGSLGFPTTDVREDGSGGTFARFEHGIITCTASGSCTIS